MARAAKPPLTGTGHLKALSTAKLDELIEEAIVDAYDESEQTSRFYSMLEEHLAIPFAIDMLGVEATVERVDLPCPDVLPAGWEWIEAHRRWARGR
jgi:hypothetical protein